MYYGAAHLALNWFEHLGYSCPAGMNIADFMLDLSNGKLDGEGRWVEDAGASEAHAKQLPKNCEDNRDGFTVCR